jgi:ATP/maltotriose-dependent transcriptional regulator MalT/DNA-binding SARP family transcriptional activator
MDRDYKSTHLAKITLPVTRNVISRDRLFKIIDSETDRPIIWLSSPAGSGKTSLISSYINSRKLKCLWYQIDEGDSDIAAFFYYMGLAVKKVNTRKRKPMPLLTPEYLGSVATFTRRYFEELYNRIAATNCSVIVLDNFQDVKDKNHFYEMLGNGLDVIPEGIKVIIISRTEAPPQFIRLKAKGKINFIGWNELRFTPEEAKMLIQGRQLEGISGKAFHRIYEITQGWAAGITLLLENIRGKAELDEFETTLNFQDIFDYFVNEIFEKLEPKVQDFLLKTSFLPVVDALVIDKLTGYEDGYRIFAELDRSNFFINKLEGKRQDFQYHPLFRDFLMNRARVVLNPDVLSQIQKQAGHILEQSGQIEEAAILYNISGDWESLIRIVVNNAPELFKQGRNISLLSWIGHIERLTTVENPWIYHWKGMCCLPVDMTLARANLYKAHDIFKKNIDTEGIFLSWAGIVDAYALELDEWRNLDDCIDALNDLMKQYPEFPSKLTELIVSSRMLISLTLRKTDNLLLVDKWLSRVSALLQENRSFSIRMDTVFYMSVYYLWRGEYRKNAAILKRADDEIKYESSPPFSVIRIKLMKGIHCCVTAQCEDAFSIISEGLEISQREGICIFDFLLWNFKAEAAMALGRIKIAKESLRQMKLLLNKAKTLDIYFFNILSSWFALLTGNISLATEHLESIKLKTEQMGTPYYKGLWHIGMAYSTFFQGFIKDAESHINSAYQISLLMKSNVLEWFSLVTKSYFLLKQGSKEEGIKLLKKGLILGKTQGYALLEFYLPPVMQYLYSIALTERFQAEYVKGLIRKLGLTPPFDSLEANLYDLYTDNWPYPVNISTLGRFEILINDKPIEFVGKIPQKPIELLKAIIAYGGINVPENRLADALWPEAEGDLAHKSLEMTLIRLRRLFGDVNFVRYNSRQVSIDTQYCLVDAINLEHLINRMIDCPLEQIGSIWEKVSSLYKGHFLDYDTENEWAFSMRERLKNKMIRAVHRAGNYFEKNESWDAAIECYQKGLEVDSFIETLYQRLMVCYSAMSRSADVIKTYNKCKDALSFAFGIKPSRQTESIYHSIIQK